MAFTVSSPEKVPNSKQSSSYPNGCQHNLIYMLYWVHS
jgi:hypothetical protein